MPAEPEVVLEMNHKTLIRMTSLSMLVNDQLKDLGLQFGSPEKLRVFSDYFYCN